MGERLTPPSGRRELPHLGRRIVKTAFAVFICLLIYALRGYHGQDMPTESAITAIICMQPYMRDSREYAFNRFTGTLIGAAWGLLFLLLLLVFPVLGAHRFVLYELMAFGVLVSLYTAVLLGKTDASSLAAIVFLCVVISFPDIEAPLQQAGERLLDVFIGTSVAIGVNVFRLPRVKRPGLVFFLHTEDLAADRFSPIPPAVLFHLNTLHDDEAQICLMSEHAPAFFLPQLSAARLNLPLIVMDGAAIYDAKENVFLQAETIPEDVSRPLRERLDALNLGYFIYTIRHHKTCIFHHGVINEQEKKIYDRMKASPYRSYLDGEIYDPNEIVYVKIIAEEAKLREIEHHLSHALPRGKLRAVIRPQSEKGLYGLYVYAHTATLDQAKKRLLQLLPAEKAPLETVELRLRGGYRNEHDAMRLLYELESRYEPVRLFHRKKS